MKSQAQNAAMVSYDEKINVISSFRKTGDVTNTAEKTGYSRSYVSDVVRGLYRNEKILNYAFRLANARRNAQNRRKA